MLDHIEHQDEAERVSGLVGLVERADVDAAPDVRVIGEERPIGLDALHGAKRGQSREEDSTAATDVENPIPPACGSKSPQDAQYDCLSGPPPPVSIVQVVVAIRVCSVQVTL